MTQAGSETNYTVRRYEPAVRTEWDGFVRDAKNGTFLFLRDYMDYHADRFLDHSLLIREGERLVAILPANRSGTELSTHAGLTYGGFIVSEAMTTPAMLEVFEAALGFLRGEGVTRLHYKTVPWIYHGLPAEEDRYALFRAGATLSRRDVLSVVQAGRRAPVQTRRRRGAAKAEKQGVAVGRSDAWPAYWAILSEHLGARYGVAPVHSLAEIQRLRDLFPDNIKLYTATLADAVLGGAVIYETAGVAHVQYIAASERGRDAGALDRLFLFLVDQEFAAKPFFDFGISNEQAGRFLNKGLIEQKEGFGGRAVVHDHYTLDL